MNAVVSNVESMIRRTLSTEIDVELAPEADLWKAEADPSQSEVALLNLVINARDAMPDGGKLTIKTDNVAWEEPRSPTGPDEISSGNYVVVTVSDTGVGMPEQVITQVFEPFFTTKEVGKGSGLGLSMVWGFVRQSNGHAQISSEPGKGTTVKLYFPAEPSWKRKRERRRNLSGWWVEQSASLWSRMTIWFVKMSWRNLAVLVSGSGRPRLRPTPLRSWTGTRPSTCCLPMW